jgi:hypothetical protein
MANFLDQFETMNKEEKRKMVKKTIDIDPETHKAIRHASVEHGVVMYKIWEYLGDYFIENKDEIMKQLIEKGKK